MITHDEIYKLLQANLPECDIKVSGEGCKLAINITGDIFIGKSPVKRQQLVYAALDEHIKSGSIHAVSIVAKTKQE